MIDKETMHIVFSWVVLVLPIPAGLIIAFIINFVRNIYEDISDRRYIRRYFR